MTDITTTNLDLALIDQMVAGTFAGQRYAYHHVMDDAGRYILGIAVANERGYSPVTGWSTCNLDVALATAKGMNDHIGVSEHDALNIVISTMGGREV